MPTSIILPQNNAILSGNAYLAATSTLPSDYVGFTIDGVERTYVPGWHGTSYSGLFNTVTCANNYTHSIFATSYRSTMSDFTPTGISNCITWFDFSDESTMYLNAFQTINVASLGGANNTPISGIKDKSNTFTAKFLVPSGKGSPIYYSNQFNRLGCVQFTPATSSILENVVESYKSRGVATNSGEVFIVTKMGGNTGQVFYAVCGGSNTFMEFGNQNGNLCITGQYNGVVSVPSGSTLLNTNTLYAINYRSDGTRYDMDLNGSAQTIGIVSGQGANSGLWIGNLSPDPTNITIGGAHFGSFYGYANAQICEIIVYGRPLNTTERTNVEAYLAQKWGSSYPSGFTYTGTASSPVNFTVNNDSGIQWPSINNNYSHIKTWQLAYQGAVKTNNGPPSDQTLLNNSIDILSGGDIGQIRNTFQNQKLTVVKYDILSQTVDYQVADWIDYATRKGYNIEDAFFHCTGVPFSQTNASQAALLQNQTGGSTAFPVSIWWDAITSVGGVSTSQYTLYNTHFNDFTTINLSNVSGDYALVGYPDPFDQMNFYIKTVAGAGWSGVIEYPYAVDSNNVPTGWAVFPLVKDTTSMFTAKSGIPGQMTWFPFPTPAWKRSVTVSGGSPNIDVRGKPLYYARLKTTKAGVSAPILSGIWAADYTQQSGISYNVGFIPIFDANVDANHDGYLSDAEYANASRNPTYTARFFYQSRLNSTFGINVWQNNVSNATYREWAVDYNTRFNSSFSGLINGNFLDDSVVGIPAPQSQTIEVVPNLQNDYGRMCMDVWRSFSSGLYQNKQGHVVLNVGGTGWTTEAQLISYCPAVWYETMILDTDNWSYFEAHATRVLTNQKAFSPEPIQVCDSNSLYGPTTDRWRMAVLSAYYCMATSGTYFSPLADNGTTLDIYPNRWWNAIGFDMGQMTAPYSIFASGQCPEDNRYTYRIYQRPFTNGIALYKPLAYAPIISSLPGTGITNNNSRTTHTLDKAYYPVNADGTLGTASQTISLRNGEGALLYYPPAPPNPPVTSGDLGFPGGTIYSIEGESVVVFAPKSSQITIGVRRRGIGWQSNNPFVTVQKYINRFTKVGIHQNPSGTYTLTTR